ncbi:MAG: hypothetical protein PHC51_10585 [bacterium]|nr:hypothetical protein [bacterium]
MKSQEELAAEWEASLLAAENASGTAESVVAVSAETGAGNSGSVEVIQPVTDEPGSAAVVKEESVNAAVGSESSTRPVSPALAAPRASTGRDVTVSSLLHLMGLPTVGSIELLEKKVDILSSKLASITVKIDRLVAQVNKTAGESYLDRIDYQLSELRTILKSGKAPVKGAEVTDYSPVGSVAGDNDDGESGEHELSLSSVPEGSSEKENS